MLKSRTRNDGIKEAIQELKSVNLSDILRARHEARLKEIRDRNARDDFMKDVGHGEGEERHLIAQVLKKMSRGKDLDTIAGEVEEDTSRIEPICEAIKQVQTEHPGIAMDQVVDMVLSALTLKMV